LSNLVLAVSSSPSGLCIGHTEYIVCLHSSINSAVTWDWIAYLGSLIFGLFYSIEDLKCIIKRFFWFGFSESGVLVDAIEGLFVLFILLLLYNIISLFYVNSEELVYSVGRNRLLQRLEE
jgi:hypothetical protein